MHRSNMPGLTGIHDYNRADKRPRRHRLIDQDGALADLKPIVVIVQLQPISVIITMAAGALAKPVAIGRVDIPVVALAQDGQTELDRGKVEIVDNLDDQTSGTIKLKAVFSTTMRNCGDFVNKCITIETVNGLTIPFRAYVGAR